MADDPKPDDKGAGAPPSPEPKQDAPALSQDEWKKTVDNKFQSPDDLAKGYKDLEKKLGEQGVEIKNAREFATVVQPILETIRDDKEIFTKLESKLRGENKDNADKTTPVPDKGQDEIRSVAADLILERFESKYGITSMSDEERKTTRAAIGTAVFDLTGTPMNKVDLRRLEKVLENAYFIANKDKLIEKSKLEALAAAGVNSQAGIPGIPSSATKAGEDETLTPEEKKVAAKMSLTEQQYLEGKKKGKSGR